MTRSAIPTVRQRLSRHCLTIPELAVPLRPKTDAEWQTLDADTTTAALPTASMGTLGRSCGDSCWPNTIRTKSCAWWDYCGRSAHHLQATGCLSAERGSAACTPKLMTGCGARSAGRGRAQPALRRRICPKREDLLRAITKAPFSRDSSGVRSSSSRHPRYNLTPCRPCRRQD
jgi:hypothetical protein